jgi:hypothetical protein
LPDVDDLEACQRSLTLAVVNVEVLGLQTANGLVAHRHLDRDLDGDDGGLAGEDRPLFGALLSLSEDDTRATEGRKCPGSEDRDQWGERAEPGLSHGVLLGVPRSLGFERSPLARKIAQTLCHRAVLDTLAVHGRAQRS